MVESEHVSEKNVIDMSNFKVHSIVKVDNTVNLRGFNSSKVSHNMLEVCVKLCLLMGESKDDGLHVTCKGNDPVFIDLDIDSRLRSGRCDLEFSNLDSIPLTIINCVDGWQNIVEVNMPSRKYASPYGMENLRAVRVTKDLLLGKRDIIEVVLLELKSCHKLRW